MKNASKTTILTISGSLKSTSANSKIIRFIAMTHEQCEFIHFDFLEQIPPFNPDKENGNEAVTSFRNMIRKADAVLISSPEYAFGVPGILKNALDWTVSSGEFNEKPVAVITASPMYEGGKNAMSSLSLTLGALGTKTLPGKNLMIGNVLNKLSADGRLTDGPTIKSIDALIRSLVTAVSEWNEIKKA
jgi:chromate reductase